MLFSLLTIATGCQSSDPTPTPGNIDRTVLVYIIANNNLSSYAKEDINEMESAWDDQIEGELYVFYNGSNNTNTLYRISADDNSSVINSEVIEEYSSAIDPCDGDFFRSVIDQVQSLSPAPSYGLFVWSHGTGWLPNDVSTPLKSSELTLVSSLEEEPQVQSRLEILLESTSSENSMLRSFGSNYYSSNEVEMYDLPTILEGLEFEYIYFDACHMASVEALYELRDVTKYVISSAAEVLSYGALYTSVVPYMFGDEECTIQMAKSYYDYYNSMSSSVMQSATISVVETKKLEEVASAINALVEPQPTVEFYGMQQYGRSSTSLNDIFYDLTNFVRSTWGDNELYSDCAEAMSQAVLYEAATAKVLGTITINEHCGMSCYIPRTTEPETYATYRTKYQWATDSGLGDML